MGFWDHHSVMFIVGLVFIPRLLLLYFGQIPPQSIPPILGLVFVPRMLLCGGLTAAYWDTDPVTILICWILAIAADICAFLFKLGSAINAMNQMAS